MAFLLLYTVLSQLCKDKLENEKERSPTDEEQTKLAEDFAEKFKQSNWYQK